MRFDLTDLRLFLAVVDAGSITHGAADVGLSLAAASERLRDMETLSEVMLLERGRRGVTTTEAGDALVHHARAILHQIAQMRGELGEYAKGLRGTIRVLANTAAMTEFLPARLGPWLARYQQADIDLKERQSIQIARSIARGFAEIGILSDAVDTSGLYLRPFAVDRLVVVSARDHPLAERTSARLDELLDQHFIALGAGALQDHIDAQALKIGARLKTRVRLPTFEGICRMAGEGVGIGIIPETAARRFRRSSSIAIVKLSDSWAIRQLSVCVRDEATLTPLARSLLAHLSAEERQI